MTSQFLCNHVQPFSPMCHQAPKARMNKHSDVTAQDGDRGTLLPQGRAKTLKKGIQNRGRQISDEKDRSFEEQSSFEWGNEEEDPKRERKTKTKRQVSFDIDDKQKENTKSTEIDPGGSCHDDTCVNVMEPASRHTAPWGRSTSLQQYPGYEHHHYPNGSPRVSQQPTQAAGHISEQHCQPLPAHGKNNSPYCTNTIGQSCCSYQNTHTSSAVALPGPTSNSNSSTLGLCTCHDRRSAPFYSSQPCYGTSTGRKQSFQRVHSYHEQFHNVENFGGNPELGGCQNCQPMMSNSMQVMIRDPSSTSLPPLQDSFHLLGGDLSKSPDYGSCTLTPDYSSDNFQETFMKHISPVTNRKAEGPHHHSAQAPQHLSNSTPNIAQDVQGANWPYLVPQFDDLYSSDYDLSAHYKATTASPEEHGGQHGGDKDSDNASIHLDYSQIYNTGYYQLTYCDSDNNSQKERLSQNNPTQEHNAPVQNSNGGLNHNGCIQNGTADNHCTVVNHHQDATAEASQKRQVSVDSNKSLVSDFDGHDDTAELLPKRIPKSKCASPPKKSQWKNNKSKSFGNEHVNEQRNNTAKMKPTLLSSKKCFIKFHSLEIKPEDIVEANKMNKLYASNLGEKAEDIWMCDFTSPDDKVNSKTSIVEDSLEILDERENTEHNVRDIDFWDYDNSSSNSNYLGHTEISNQGSKFTNQNQDSHMCEELSGKKSIVSETEIQDQCQHKSNVFNNGYQVDQVQEECYKQHQRFREQNPSKSTYFSTTDNSNAGQVDPEGSQCLLVGNPGPISSSSKKSSNRAWATATANTECSPGEGWSNSIEVKVEIHPHSQNDVTGLEEKQDKEKGEKETRLIQKYEDKEGIITESSLILGNSETGGQAGEINSGETIVSKEGATAETEEVEDKNKPKGALPSDQSGEHVERQNSDASCSERKTNDSRNTPSEKCIKQQQAGPVQYQKVVYYQNRFITVPIDPRNCKARSISREKLRSSNGSVEGKKSATSAGGNQPADDNSINGGKPTSAQTKEAKQPAKEKGSGKQNSAAVVTKSASRRLSKGSPGDTNGDMNPIELENSIITMHSVGDKTSNTRCKDEVEGGSGVKRNGTLSKADAVFSKFKEILQDKRCDDDELAQKSPVKRHSTDPILKKILNIVFIATGVILLLGVIIVILYTTLGKPGTRPGDSSYEAALEKSRSNTNQHQDPNNQLNNLENEDPGKTIVDIAANDDVTDDTEGSSKIDMSLLVLSEATTGDYNYGDYEIDRHFMSGNA